MRIELTDQIAVVTGGGRGIGRAIALALAEAGADVVVTWHSREEPAADTAAAITGLGRRSRSAQLDVADPEMVDELFTALPTSFGPVDILINNAGMIRDRLIGAMSVEDWDRVQQVNLRGAFLCTQAVMAHMVPRRHGKIVNIASIAALSGGRGQSNYAAAKAGLVALTRSTALELAAKDIQANAVLPGIVATDLSKSARRRAEKALLEATPLGRFATPEEVASLAVFLVSTQADAITGQAIAVDGGLSVT